MAIILAIYIVLRTLCLTETLLWYNYVS